MNTVSMLLMFSGKGKDADSLVFLYLGNCYSQFVIVEEVMDGVSMVIMHFSKGLVLTLRFRVFGKWLYPV